MKKVLLGLSLIIFAVSTLTVNAQNIIDAEDDNNFDNFYSKSLAQTKSAMPYAHLRESDVIWESAIWRTIDFREKFNQFFYFPKETAKDGGSQKRINLANTIYDAIVNGEITVYEDDELKIPLDGDNLLNRLNRLDTITVAGEEDEYGDMITEDHDSVISINFNANDYFSIHLKEYWYIDKQDTRQKVRITGLALVFNSCKERMGEMECNDIEQFWVPMDDMRVRNVLAKHNAYDEYNNALERSYDEIFVSRFFDSFITRESNRFNRNIQSYLTGEDAILESQNIEEKIFDIESDMWEY